ncbi:PTS transporter subunit EIIC [Erysipelothrix aquatica]|uniref:PTS transporter subunit EIIC n=1 Tax=Erysipelothrix aquatica TaxID=2683714 RepID=UPI0013597C90|nr:PTS transporter subunit EIIC [Erysipelothrix aquatica]
MIVSKLEHILFKAKDYRPLQALHQTTTVLLNTVIPLSMLMLLGQVVAVMSGGRWQELQMVSQLVFEIVYSYLSPLTLVIFMYVLGQKYTLNRITNYLMSLIAWVAFELPLRNFGSTSIEYISFAFMIPLCVVLIDTSVDKIMGHLTLSLPTSIPQSIKESASSLARQCFKLIAVYALIWGVMQIPFPVIGYIQSSFNLLFSVYQNPIVFLLLILVLQLLWYRGLHGDALLAAWFEPAIIFSTIINMHALIQGLPVQHIINATFYTNFAAATGAGLTGGILINYVLRRPRRNVLPEMEQSFVPALFNINEPLIFGLPIVDNCEFKVAFILAPLLASAVGYTLTVLEIMQVYTYAVPWFIPFGLKGLMGTGGDLVTALCELLIAILVIVIYAIPTRRYMAKVKEL